MWTWVAIDADSKLTLLRRIGPRHAGTAYELMQDLAGRLRNRVQLTTDRNSCYLAVVEDTFGADIDYAILRKGVRSDPDGETALQPGARAQRVF